jgi:signal transduction histidine kinase
MHAGSHLCCALPRARQSADLRFVCTAAAGTAAVAQHSGCWLRLDAYRLSRKSIKFQPQELADRLLQVQENERHRLSRELHDDIGQLLTAAKLQSEWLKRRMPEDLQEQCSVLCDTLEETLTKVRDVSAILNPRQLTSLGLEASLRAHLLKTLTNTSVHWSLECHQRLNGIPEEMAVAAFRITQEAVTNMLRHARPKPVDPPAAPAAGLTLLISDDGLGFAPAANPGREGQRGMAGMAERIEQLGGTLTVTSEPGKGTQIEALFPGRPVHSNGPVRIRLCVDL